MWIYCGGHCNQLAHYMKSHLKLHAVKHYSKLFFQSYGMKWTEQEKKKKLMEKSRKMSYCKELLSNSRKRKKKSVSYKTPVKNATTSGHTEWFGLTVMMAGWISVQNTCLLWMANFWWWNFLFFCSVSFTMSPLTTWKNVQHSKIPRQKIQ